MNNDEVLMFDGEVVESLPREFALNRAMFYGENFFTSLKFLEGDFQFLYAHLKRLEQSFSFFYQKDFSEFDERITKDLEKLKPASNSESFYFRITFFRPLDGEPNYYIVRKSLTQNYTNKVESMTHASFARGESYLPSCVKIGNYTDIFLQLSDAMIKGHNEILFSNHKNEILEASTSNVFFVKDNVVYTPPIQNGILDGVTRYQLIACLMEHNIAFKELNIAKENINTMDEIWLTNSLQGLRFVEKFNEHTLESNMFTKVEKLFANFVRENGKTGL